MSSPESPPEACPPPLMWQDVRREYLAQSAHQQIETPAGAVSVRTLGAGPPLYLLPGFSAPAELFCLLIWLLRDEFRCITIEPAGSRPENLAGQPTMDEYVQMLMAAADEFHDDSFAVFGANFGAAWGLAAAQRHSARIGRLMLTQGFLHRRLSFLERRLAAWCGWSRGALGSFPGREFFQTQNHRRWFPPFDETRWKFFLDASGQMPLRELSRRASAVSRFDLRAEAAGIPSPTLVIHTEGDGGIVEQCQADLERSLPHVQTEWLHNSGQLAYLTHPHRLAKLIRTFHSRGE